MSLNIDESQRFHQIIKLKTPSIIPAIRYSLHKAHVASCYQCHLFLQTYVTECVGVDFVGYTIMVFGLGSSLGSVISGKVLSLGVKTLLVLATLILHLAIMTFLMFWERKPNLLILLLVVFLWGLCDGSWLTICSSKCIKVNKELPYKFKFLRDVIFEVFMVNWPSAKFSSLKFHWRTLTCMNRRAEYLVILEN